MKSKFLMLFACVALLGASVACTNTSKKAVEDTANVGEDLENKVGEIVGLDMTAETLDYCGVYEGNLPPVAEGPLVKTKLQFNQDNTFSLTQVFPNQKDSVITKDGKYSVVEGVINATYADGNVGYFKIGQGNVQVLSTDQKTIEGPNAKDYFLTKIESLPNPM